MLVGSAGLPLHRILVLVRSVLYEADRDDDHWLWRNSLRTTLIWAPVLNCLADTGSSGSVAMWCSVVVGTADNIRPLVIVAPVKPHPVRIGLRLNAA